MRSLPFALMAVLTMQCVALAGSPMPVQMRCAVGGEKFTYISTASMSRWGSRPDGKPYGSWTFPTPLPECPGNGLVMYREFTRAEIKTLRGVLKSPEYLQLRSTRETPYYRAHWLMEKLGDPAIDRAWVLQQASWEADGEPDRKARYQVEFVRQATALPKPGSGEDDLGWIVMQLRAANALREQGRFDEAVAHLDALPLSSLDVPVPEEKVSGTTPSGHGKVVENYGEIRAAQNRRGWIDYAARLRAVIARRDVSSEPLDMIPPRVAAGRCESYPVTGPVFKAVCESQEIQALRERRKEIREQTAAPTSPALVPADPAKSN